MERYRTLEKQTTLDPVPINISQHAEPELVATNLNNMPTIAMKNRSRILTFDAMNK